MGRHRKPTHAAERDRRAFSEKYQAITTSRADGRHARGGLRGYQRRLNPDGTPRRT